MDQRRIIEEAKKFSKKSHALDYSGHDWWHVWRVSELAKHIAQEEGADAYICELSALLHDIADEKLTQSEKEGLKEVKLWLQKHEVSLEDTEHVMDIVESIAFKGGGRPPMKTLEGKIVQDADRLDAIGAIGIARTFAYSGANQQLLYDPDIKPREFLTRDSYRNEKSTAINHFYEKLLKLKTSLNTNYAKKLAEHRHEFLNQYLKTFILEWHGKA